MKDLRDEDAYIHACLQRSRRGNDNHSDNHYPDGTAKGDTAVHHPAIGDYTCYARREYVLRTRN
jgi:hypothetical protein